jgi:glyoxylase-like metal-dependent hydrolase (beta-lactamase superfamily II)
MVLEKIPRGIFASNCYIIGENGEGVIIDPGVSCQYIMDKVNKCGLAIKYIILTHAHIDHIASVDEIRINTGAKVAIHREDSEALSDYKANASWLLGRKMTFLPADLILNDKDVLSAGGMEFRVIHTPGHTPGGICIAVGDMIFSGDTLCREAIGRTDIGNGSMRDILDSVKNKLYMLDDNVIVYPGHGPETTIGYEKKHNPFVR